MLIPTVSNDVGCLQPRPQADRPDRRTSVLRSRAMWWRLLVGWVLIAVAFYLTTVIVPGIHVGGGIFGYLLVAAVFGLVNAILGPILRIASLPLRILTLGLFSLVINRL